MKTSTLVIAAVTLLIVAVGGYFLLLKPKKPAQQKTNAPNDDNDSADTTTPAPAAQPTPETPAQMQARWVAQGKAQDAQKATDTAILQSETPSAFNILGL